MGSPASEPDDRIPKEFHGLDKRDLREWAKREGLPDQRLYRMGMPHANCGGGCIKAGTAHFKKLLEVFPERYAEWEKNELETVAAIQALRPGKLEGKLGLIRDRSGGTATYKTLKVFREEQEAGGQLSILDQHDWGGCGCALE